MATGDDMEIAMRKKFRGLLGKENSKPKPDKKVLDNIKCQLAEWDLNARN